VTEKLIECDCGWTCRGTDESLIAECTVHAREAHGMELTPEQILAVAVPVDEPDAAR
jgi:predicted small metal-binding protein